MRTLLRILEIKHLSKNGEVLWESRNLSNVLHEDGELYCLSALFNGEEVSIPANYYAGLDNRATPDRTDTLENLSQEPTQFAYSRQPISSATGFSVEANSNEIMQATSGVLTFIATGGTWGPIRNLFLATSANNTGYLISTAPLDGQHSLADGEQLTMRLALTLRDFSE